MAHLRSFYFFITKFNSWWSKLVMLLPCKGQKLSTEIHHVLTVILGFGRDLKADIFGLGLVLRSRALALAPKALALSS